MNAPSEFWICVCEGHAQTQAGKGCQLVAVIKHLLSLKLNILSYECLSFFKKLFGLCSVSVIADTDCINTPFFSFFVFMILSCLIGPELVL